MELLALYYEWYKIIRLSSYYIIKIGSIYESKQRTHIDIFSEWAVNYGFLMSFLAWDRYNLLGLMSTLEV